MPTNREGETAVTIPLQYNEAHWKAIFEKYDLDGDGKISLQELKAMIRGPEFSKDIPAGVVRTIMHKADLDDSGYLEYPEFIAMIHRKDMQGIFGHIVQRYVQCVIPQRPCRTLRQTSVGSRYYPQRQFSTVMQASPAPVIKYRSGSPLRKIATFGVLDSSRAVVIERSPSARFNALQQQTSTITESSLYSSDYPDGLYEEEYSCRPPAIAMIIISIIEIILFIYDVIKHKSLSVEGPAATLFIYNPHKRYQAWRYLTYMFVHVGVFHLVVNLLVQIMLGIPLEMVHKWWRVLIIYIAGVLAGSLGTSVSDPTVYLAGASGGVYALITAHVATIIMNWSQMEFAVLQLLVFLVITSVDVGQAVYNRYVLDTNDQIGYVAHLAGAIAGLLVGINILRNLEVQTWEKVIWWASIVTFTGLMTTAILWNILYPSYYD
ncbi:protein rhomboid isoform X2 [Mycetomoellerius zeteki]|nr:PREDICTED: protein rhomboid isoform X2 [Trachymyrmex zeteki]XP_018315168.1 PREDICTED: protein rhomboid isoform X2 [Trachymyrmex zeteki]XP_018315177.1 PREDICTED: protein rhomboid isoform X2 [Trachymyrmex zeteki]XP_018315187.1 PREDICTED: protein rhomboid isoform X2 [Trachymyrmex zeteki]XP_018315197.1 PREDICTED: protein rhomboid isoform X2 [Trachymyrmex zeteki]